MKKLKLVYNSKSGNRSFKNEIDVCIKVFQEAGYDVSIFRSCAYNDIQHHLNSLNKNEFDTIVAAGGDGTLNTVVNYIVKHNINSKLGIIPAGTANDFARHLKIEKPYKNAAEVIARGHTIKVDVGRANDTYFINVFGAGLLTNISHHVDTNVKSTLGNIAYYLKGLEKLQSFTPMPIRIINSNEVIEEDIYFFLALNSSGAGSFDKLAKNALINDGLFDFLAVKSSGITELAALALKFLKGDHINDSRVIHFKDNYVKLEPREKNNKASFETNIDGENGPSMPLEIKNIPSAIEVFA